MKSKGRAATSPGHDRIPARRLAALKRSIPDGEELEGFTATFGLLGDARRLRMLAALRKEAELCVCDLAEVAGMEESAASHALRLLRAHGVVRARRSGRMVYYSIRDERVRRLLDSSVLGRAFE
jgi:ArsR family transcriptional regulator, lead/cadmium/zinc/bismuth-responsive transcriptional repressor